MLVLLCILASPEVPTFVNRVRYTSYTTLSGILYLVLTFRSIITLVVNILRSKVQGTFINR